MNTEKIRNFVKTHRKAVIGGSVALVTVLLVLHITLFGGVLNAGDNLSAVRPSSQINPRIKEIEEKGAVILSPSEELNSTAAGTQQATKRARQKKTNSATTAPATQRPTAATTPSGNVVFATAAPVGTPADYNAQWDQGYLVAIDNPDTSYSTAQITLTDEDRDLLERLCYGEFGGGGFVGASLIAQSVKDAMCFDGYTSVAQVINEYKYTGSTTSGKNTACQQAVKYVFDENRDAVQHRIMYMYNPYMVSSEFHESQKFILSYENVRFFDRWH